MTKKVLMLAAKANMIQQFNHRNIKILQNLGYEVHVATNMVDFGSMSAEENERFKQWMSDNNVVAHQVDFERRMGSIKGNIQAIKQLRQIFLKNHFTFIHVHSPLGSVLGRIVAKQYKVPVIYTAHGFHFFKGSSKISWFIFFPLEWLFSFVTDTLITINEEDYELAKRYMHANHTVKISGVGVDVEKAWRVTDEEKLVARRNIRRELNIPDNAFLISSVGELSDRKNHKVVLEALQKFTPEQRQSIYYIVAGTGVNGEMLKKLAVGFDFEKNFKLLGYRSDVHNINYASDVSVFPSLREGLGLAGLDATIDGVYLIGSNKGGISEYIQNNINGNLFDPTNADELSSHIKNMKYLPRKATHHEFLLKFDVREVDKVMNVVYRRVNGE